jgi:pyruvate kinase
MDVARFNFSHGTHESHLEMLERVRRAAKAAGRPIAALLDTKGPEIRTGLLKGHSPVVLEKGSRVTLTPMYGNTDAEGDAARVYTTYEGLADDISEGGTILVDDGTIELKAGEIRGKDVLCTVVTGGMLDERKGINLPGVSVGLPDLTDKDIEDIAFGLENGFDFIAASFVCFVFIRFIPRGMHYDSCLVIGPKKGI